jgi:hypothetical protein
MLLDDFLTGAGGDGPCVAIVSSSHPPLTPSAGVELRIVEGASMPDLDGVFNVFADAWHFPSRFGHNAAAFDDFMCDLDDTVDAALHHTRARAYLSEIANAHLLLVDQIEAFRWFVRHIEIYRNYYRDEADPTADFALVLRVPVESQQSVYDRWTKSGIAVAALVSYA